MRALRETGTEAVTEEVAEGLIYVLRYPQELDTRMEEGDLDEKSRKAFRSACSNADTAMTTILQIGVHVVTDDLFDAIVAGAWIPSGEMADPFTALVSATVSDRPELLAKVAPLVRDGDGVTRHRALDVVTKVGKPAATVEVIESIVDALSLYPDDLVYVRRAVDALGQGAETPSVMNALVEAELRLDNQSDRP